MITCHSFFLFLVFAFIIGSTIGFTFLRPYMLCNVTDQSWGELGFIFDTFLRNYTLSYCVILQSLPIYVWKL